MCAALGHVWKPEDNFVDLVLSLLLHVGSGDQTQVSRKLPLPAKSASQAWILFFSFLKYTFLPAFSFFTLECCNLFLDSIAYFFIFIIFFSKAYQPSLWFVLFLSVACLLLLLDLWMLQPPVLGFHFIYVSSSLQFLAVSVAFPFMRNSESKHETLSMLYR